MPLEKSMWRHADVAVQIAALAAVFTRFTLAAEQQYRHAQLRSDSATMQMTREQVAEGNLRVQKTGRPPIKE